MLSLRQFATGLFQRLKALFPLGLEAARYQAVVRVDSTVAALGTLSLSWLGAIGAGLTVGLKRGNVLVSLIVLPLAMPLLIFGAGATDRAASGISSAGALYLLGSLCVFTCTLAPLAVAAALRITLE